MVSVLVSKVIYPPSHWIPRTLAKTQYILPEHKFTQTDTNRGQNTTLRDYNRKEIFVLLHFRNDPIFSLSRMPHVFNHHFYYYFKYIYFAYTPTTAIDFLCFFSPKSSVITEWQKELCRINEKMDKNVQSFLCTLYSSYTEHLYSKLVTVPLNNRRPQQQWAIRVKKIKRF